MKSYNFHLISLLVLVVFFSILCPQQSHAALTKQLSYQGRLNNASGQPVANGTYSIVFSIYNVSSGGSALWTETQNVSVDSGGFSAYLGSVTALTLPFNEDYYLGIKVGSDPEMTPRMKLAVVGTAAFALESDKLQGKAASDFALSTHTHTITVGTSEITDGSINAGDIDATTVQKRVTGTCAGQVLVAINQDGTVTCEADDTGGGGGGTSLTPAATVTSITTASIVGTSLNYAREDHQHNMVSNFITDSLVSSSAGIATSKLSGAVTSISGHGLGSLATLNAVSGAEIQDGTILFADIASNSCASGQVIEYNGTAWICGTDDVGGGGDVITNPTSTQTIIAGNSTTTPLVLKAAASPSSNLFEVKDNADAGLLYVNPTGNLLVGNPSTTAKVSAEETGTTGVVGYFKISNASNISAALTGNTNGGGPAIYGLTSGNGNAVRGASSGTGNAIYAWSTGAGSGTALYARTDGTGNAGNFYITNASNTSSTILGNTTGTGNLLQLQKGGVDKFVVTNTGNTLIGNPALTTAKVSAQESGATNNAGIFIASNAANADAALYAETYGTGPAINGKTSGTGWAGFFEVANASNSTQVLKSVTNGLGATLWLEINNAVNANPLVFGNIVSGTGELMKLQQGSVDKFVVSNAGNVTANGSITAFNGTNAVAVTGGGTQQLIQSGNSCEAVATDGSIAVTYSAAYAAAPIVTVRQTNGTGAASIYTSTSFTSTTTGFTIPGLESSVSTECFDWIAIGNK